MESNDQIVTAIIDEEYQISVQIRIFMIKYGSMLDVIRNFEFTNLELALLADVQLSIAPEIRDKLKL